jgi:STE24 endopeptidase
MAMRMRTVFSVRRTVGLPIALVAAVVVAEAAVLVLRPRDLGPAPLPVEARAYFSSGQLEKAEAFRSGQLWLYGATLLIEAGVLILVVRRPPERLRRAGRRHPVLAGAAAAAALSVAVGLAPLPVSAIAQERARDVGLVTQSWLGWAGDVAKSQAIGALFAAGGGALLIVGMRRFGRRWWIPGAAVVVAFGVIITYAGPVVLDPLFNTFKKLPGGQTRSDVLGLARRAGVDVGQVYEIDASRRTSAANAYVNGIGHTKRVVLYDTLLRKFTPAEIDSVVAHELGHVKHRDVPRGLLWLAIVAPAGMLVVQRLTERLAPEARLGRGAGPAVLPAAALSIALVAFVINIPGNAMSRRIEASADAYSLEIDGNPAAMIGLERRLAIQNVADPDPPDWLQFIFGTHPKTVQRIGAALTWARTH